MCYCAHDDFSEFFRKFKMCTNVCTCVEEQAETEAERDIAVCC